MFDTFLEVRWSLEFLKRKNSEYKRPTEKEPRDW